MASPTLVTGEPPVAPLFGRRGVVLSCHPLAAATGAAVLQEGGNAVDAAVAATWVEMVVLPMATGLGGDVLALVRTGGSDRPTAVLGLGPAPQAASLEAARARGWRQLPPDGIWAASVPAAVDALEQLRERWGRVDRRRLLQPAIAYARQGFRLSRRAARLWAAARLADRGNPECRRVLLAGGLPKAGDWVRQPDLAVTLEEVAADGRQGFYGGRFGQALLNWARAEGAWFSAADLTAPSTVCSQPWPSPAAADEWLTPAPSAGVVVWLARALLAEAGMGATPAESMGRVARARAAALALRRRLPATAWGDLAAGRHPAGRWPDWDAWVAFVGQAGPPPPAAPPAPGTSLVAAADGDGNQIAIMHSLSGLSFGSAAMVPGTGVVLNARLARGVSLNPGEANALQGGRVPDSTLVLWARRQPDGVWLIGGTPGGDQQALWAITSLAALDQGRSLPQVVAAPRWHDVGDGRRLIAEDRLPREVVAALGEQGWVVETVGPWAAAGGMAVVAWDGEGPVGIADPRIEGGQAAC